MPTLTDDSMTLFGRAGSMADVRASAAGAVSGSSSIRYGIAQADSSGGSVLLLLDGNLEGNTVMAACSTPVSRGQRVSVMYQNGRYEVIALDDISKRVSSTLSSADMEYGISSDPATEPESWSTEAAVPGPDEYLWQRQRLTDTAGNVTYGKASVIAAGSKDGGLSLSSVREQYYLSTSSTEQVGGEWTYSQPSITSGHYVWMRTEMLWSDGSYTYSETILANALNQAFAQYEAVSARVEQNQTNVTIAIESVRKQAEVGTKLDSDVRSFFEFGADGSGDPLLRMGSSGSPMVNEQTNKAQTYKYAGTEVLKIDGEHGRVDAPKYKMGDYEWRGSGTSLQLVYAGG